MTRTRFGPSSLVFLLLAFLCASLARQASAQADGTIQFNERFLGLISSPTDVDLVAFEEAGGSKVTVVVTAESGNFLKPTFELLDAGLNVVATAQSFPSGGKKALLKKFVLPASGTWFVRVASKNGLTGTYKVKVVGKPPVKFQGQDDVTTVGEIRELVFSARAGSKLKGKLVRASGDVMPLPIELEDPSGQLVNIAPSVEQSADGSEAVFEAEDLPRTGDYRLRYVGQGGTTGAVTYKIKVKTAKPVKGKVYEEEHPDADSQAKGGFTLLDIEFGRGLRSPDGLTMQVVSPFSLVDFDPISDLPVPGTLRPLFEGGDLDELVSFHLGPLFTPPVVPRNAVLVLRFSRKVDLESLNLDAEGNTTNASPILITMGAKRIPMEVFQDGKNLILNPVHGEQVGFPESPIAFDPAGNPAADVKGVARLLLLHKGNNVLRSVDGSVYEPRADLLGSPQAGGEPIGFNPGNRVLDFFEQFDATAAGASFGGFLPDVKPPRIVRELTYDDTFDPDFVDPMAGDQINLDSITLVTDQPFNVEAKGGDGEWAGGLVIFRPEQPDEEQHVIGRHTATPLTNGKWANTFTLESPIVIPPEVGGPVRLVRAEFFEPDPNDPIDPATFDPDNPELEANTDLLNFVEARDRNGQLQDLTQPLDPITTFSIRFSEPMALESLRPYETFFVTDDPPLENFGLNQLGVIELSERGKVATFRPERAIQFGPDKGTTEQVGFGPEGRDLRLHIKVVPTADVIEGLLGPQGREEFEREGHRGVTDVGGQPLAFPLSMISASQPFVEYSFAFATADDPALPRTGAVVHRFLGAPVTGFDNLGNTGIRYRDVPPELCGDQNNLYGPRIADINIFTNGFLSGAPVQFFQKIHDDFNLPLDPTVKEGPVQMNAFPFGASTPIGGFAVLGGCRFQHVYRAVDASPDWLTLAGTNLDLTQLEYAPVAGLVTETVLPDFAVLASHSPIVPDTRQGGGIPSHPNSGLEGFLANNDNAEELDTGKKHSLQIVAGEDPSGNLSNTQGVAFTISQSLVHTPLGTQRAYHPLPDQPFNHPFAYNNGARDVATFSSPKYGGGAPTWGGEKGENIPESLLIEYRVTVVSPDNPPQNQNGFTFAVGILSSALPRFRVFSIGESCVACCNPNGAGGCAANCNIAFGPAMDGLPAGTFPWSGGGPPLDPDQIVRAAGPAPAPPGMQCFCLQSPLNPTVPNPCVQQQTPPTPTIDQVALGQAGNPSNNNFGDNSRYFMIFHYVKRESFLRSPFVRVQPVSVTDPIFDPPIFDPPLDEIPEGTVFDIKFEASPTGGVGGLDATPLLTPAQMADPDNDINNTPNTPFIRFQVNVEANTTTLLVPVFDEIVIPFRYTQ